MSSPARILLTSSPVTYSILREPAATLKGDAQSGWSATLSCLVARSDLPAFAAFCGGTPQTITLSGGQTVSRVIPASHPDYNSLLCQSVDTVNIGSFDPTPGLSPSQQNWSHARVNLGFNSVPFPTDGSTPFLVVETDVGGQSYTLAGKKYAFSDGTPIGADASESVPQIEYTVSVFMATNLGDDLAASLIANPVNSVTFLNRPAGTVRFNGFRSRYQMSASFVTNYSKQFNFSFRPVPWNEFLLPNGTWDTPTKPDGSYVYGTSDLNALLQ